MRLLRHFIQDPRYLATFVSLLLTLMVLTYQQPLNLDGIIYLNAAETLLKHGFKASMAVYAWPFYPALIAGVSVTTHLSLLSSAYLLNSLFATLIVLIFITLCKHLGATRSVQYFAALVILIYPYLNHYRDEVIRDYGYYAFALLSLLQLLRFLHTSKWRYAWGWGLAISIASLFRLEGILLQLFVPLLVFIPRINLSISRIKAFVRLNSVNVLLLLLLVLWMTISQHHAVDLGRIKELVLYSLQFLNSLQNKLTILQQQLFLAYGEKAIPSFFAGGVLALFIYSFLHTCGVLYALLAAYAWRYKLMPAAAASQLAIVTYILINVGFLLFFATQQLFLTGRYIALLCFLVMLYVPFSLNYLLQRAWYNKEKWLTAIVVLWLLALCIDSTIHPGPSKTYITKAGAWIAHNTPVQSRLYSNDAQLMYLSQRTGLEYPKDFTEGKVPFSTLVKQPWQDYDYLALVIPRKQSADIKKILAVMKSSPLCIFVNNRGDKAIIFKIAKEL